MDFITVPAIVKHGWRLATKTGILPLLVFSNLFLILINLIESWMMVSISNGNTDYITYYVFLQLFSTWLRGIMIKKWGRMITKKINEAMISEELKKYDSLSFESKNEQPASIFLQQLERAEWAIENLMGWGVSRVFQFIASFFSCVMIFYTQKMYMYLPFLIGFNVLSYYLFSKKLQANYDKEMNICTKQRKIQRNTIILNENPFQQGDVTVEKMIKEKSKLSNIYTNVDKTMNKIMTITEFTNKFGLIFVCFNKDITVIQFLLIMNVLLEFNSMISGLLNFFTNFQRHNMDYTTYMETWKNVTYTPKPYQIPFPTSFTITDVSISRSTWTLQFDSIDSVEIRSDSKILITGPSGGGKSTFLNGFSGNIAGLSFNDNIPSSHIDYITTFYQSIKENFPTSRITVRQLFEDEKDDDLIKRCCEIACVYDWVSELTEKNAEKIADETSIEMEKKSVFDIDINERISGGQKSRVALATRIYKMFKDTKKQVFILDEPEQGSDAQLAYKLIKNVLEAFSDKIIIVVSHLEHISDERFFNWTNMLKIESGRISNGVYSHKPF
jgi:ABC-type bacteriocin/lantibiotic exporter with double-glycine peptidase domain